MLQTIKTNPIPLSPPPILEYTENEILRYIRQKSLYNYDKFRKLYEYLGVKEIEKFESYNSSYIAPDNATKNELLLDIKKAFNTSYELLSLLSTSLDLEDSNKNHTMQKWYKILKIKPINSIYEELLKIILEDIQSKSFDSPKRSKNYELLLDITIQLLKINRILTNLYKCLNGEDVFTSEKYHTLYISSSSKAYNNDPCYFKYILYIRKTPFGKSFTKRYSIPEEDTLLKEIRKEFNTTNELIVNLYTTLDIPSMGGVPYKHCEFIDLLGLY